MNKMLEHLMKIVKSRQFWTGVALFVINGIDGIRELIPDQVVPYINSFVGLLAIYFRIQPKQKFEKEI